ncbi:MAG: aldehyde dehydrogenase family protein [Firmicutes bacterium]|nr:aldehyde dehydrogenase family protein [Bacillota bacterium]
MREYKYQYIDGQWREGTGSHMLENRNPYTGELLYTYRSASTADVDAAYAAAARAQKEWAKTSPHEKQGMLEKLAQAVEELREDAYECLITEGGSTRPKADFEVATCIEFIKRAMNFPLMMNGKIMPSNIPGKENFIYREPKGVICVIAPWNVPMLLAMRSVAPAIATGNAVVLKPATDTPGSAFLLAEAFDRAGFPPGLFNVIAGRGCDIGDYIVEHPVPSLISFTGSTEVGRRVGALAGGKIKDVSLELGGNNVMIVLPDADIKEAAKAAVFGAFFHQGQVCMALNRIIACKEIYDAFIQKLVEIAGALKVGDPADPETFIGPIINSQQADKIEKVVRDTIAAGAKVALEGRREGNLIYPWILVDCTNDMPAARQEIFGPAVCIIKANDEDEAVRIANDTEYGLSGSVFTGDLFHGIQVARQVHTGMIHVNDQSINDEPHVMFGGEKCSGVGRFNDQWVVDKFTTEKWVSIQSCYRAFS